MTNCCVFVSFCSAFCFGFDNTFELSRALELKLNLRGACGGQFVSNVLGKFSGLIRGLFAEEWLEE
jgi:hypothetical protein